jgi:hypothetical protein
LADEFLKELLGVGAAEMAGAWFPRADDFGQRQEIRSHGDEVVHKSAVIAGFGADQKRGAFGSEGVAAVGGTGEELKTDQKIHDGGEASRGCTSFAADFFKSLGAAIEHVENAILDCGVHGQRMQESPDDLHHALRSNLRSWLRAH